MSCDSEPLGRKMTLHFFRHFLWVFCDICNFLYLPHPEALAVENGATASRLFFFLTETLIFIAFLLYQFVLISGYLFIDVFSFKKKTILSLVLYMNEVLHFDTMWLLLV